MTNSYRLISMPYAQTHVDIVEKDGYVTEVNLYSYHTKILEVKACMFDLHVIVHYPVACSVTTARHVNRFTTEIAGENLYHQLKKVPLGGCHVSTGNAFMLSDFVQYYKAHAKFW